MTTTEDEDSGSNHAAQGKKTPQPAGSAHTAGSGLAPIPAIALAVAVAALGLAGWAVLKPSTAGSPATAAPTAQPQQDATDQLCNAFEVVRKAVALNANATAPGGPEDRAGGIAVAANARLALLGGGQYLASRIDPSDSSELATQARELAASLSDIGATALSGVPTTEPTQADRMRHAETLSVAVAEDCQSR